MTSSSPWPLLESISTRIRCNECKDAPLSLQTSSKYPAEYLLLCPRCGKEFTQNNRVFNILPQEIDSFEGKNQSYYNQMSANPDNLLFQRAKTRNYRNKANHVLGSLDLNSDQKQRTILEIGAGYSLIGKMLCDMGHSWVGVDISSGLLENTLKIISNDSAIGFTADATKLPFADNAFDAVFCIATLHHIPNPQLAVREAIRVINPCGRFCFLEPKRLYPTQFFQWLNHRETEISSWKMTTANVSKWAENAGVSDIQNENIIFTPNKPQMMKSAYDCIDKLCKPLPFLRHLSVMFSVQGTK